jgi:hypothetical protein
MAYNITAQERIHKRFQFGTAGIYCISDGLYKYVRVGTV